MNKNQFIKELRYKLRSLPEYELNDALSYYEEYFEDAQVDSYVNVETELGSTSSIASQILSDYAVKDLNLENNNKTFNISSVWFIILAILASPIALPIGFSFIIIIASLIFTIAILVVSLGATAVAIGLSGIATLSFGFSVITSSFSTFILFTGFGLTLCGVGLLALVYIFALGRYLLRYIVKFSNKSLVKVNNRFKSKEI